MGFGESVKTYIMAISFPSCSVTAQMAYDMQHGAHGLQAADCKVLLGKEGKMNTAQCHLTFLKGGHFHSSWRNKDIGVIKIRHIFLSKLWLIFHFHQSCTQSFTQDSNLPNKPLQAPLESPPPTTPSRLRMKKHHPGSSQYLHSQFSSFIRRGNCSGKERQIFNILFF